MQFESHDQCGHNLSTYARRSEPFNRTLPEGWALSVELQEVEVFPGGDGLHPWMIAHVFVTDAQAFAVSDSESSFSLEGPVPDSYADTW